MRVGDYVRTILGITKYLGNYKYTNFITGKTEKSDMHEFDKLNEDLWSGDIANVIYDCELEDIIIKSSPNIMDLIEVGDYVDGFKIDDITEKDEDHPERIAWHLTYYGDDDIPFRNEEIKSVVTKEQFEAIKYEIK